MVDAIRGAEEWVAATRYAREHNAKLDSGARGLAFYPMRPIPVARINTIAARLGLRIDFAIHPGEPVIAWDNGTWFRERARRRLPPDAINAACTDISKSRVDREWASIAGYSIAVDPLTFAGPLVVKSERNGRHDGLIVRGPIPARRSGYVYQRFVNSVEGALLMELRTTIIGGEIPVVLERGRPATRWYADTTLSIVRAPADLFSSAESAQLTNFARRIGLDYGELDVLRDRDSGLIYVVDANRTPSGPEPHERSAHVEKVTALMAEPFARLMAARWPEPG